VKEQSIDTMTYEQAYQSLETILQKLELNTCTLEESMTFFTQAQILLQHCEKILQEADLKVKQYVNGKWEDLPN